MDINTDSDNEESLHDKEIREQIEEMKRQADEALRKKIEEERKNSPYNKIVDYLSYKYGKNNVYKIIQNGTVKPSSNKDNPVHFIKERINFLDLITRVGNKIEFDYLNNIFNRQLDDAHIQQIKIVSETNKQYNFNCPYNNDNDDDDDDDDKNLLGFNEDQTSYLAMIAIECPKINKVDKEKIQLLGFQIVRVEMALLGIPCQEKSEVDDFIELHDINLREKIKRYSVLALNRIKDGYFKEMVKTWKKKI